MIKISTINQAISKNEVQVLDSSIYSGHEKILFCKDTSTNLKAIIAVHSTKLGPDLVVVECGTMKIKTKR